MAETVFLESVRQEEEPEQRVRPRGSLVTCAEPIGKRAQTVALQTPGAVLLGEDREAVLHWAPAFGDQEMPHTLSACQLLWRKQILLCRPVVPAPPVSWVGSRHPLQRDLSSLQKVSLAPFCLDSSSGPGVISAVNGTKLLNFA